MRILFIIFILNLSWLTQQHQNFSSEDLCNLEIHQLKCPDNYNYKCKLDKCSVDEAACKLFDLKRYQTLHVKSLVMFQSNLKKYETFMKNIKKCLSIWQPNKICLNVAKCSTLKFNNSTMKFNKISEKKCKCIGQHSFGCARVCALDRNVCRAFNSEAKKNKKLYEDLTFCNNGMKIYLSFHLF
jgi:hypothetical protein